MRELTADIIISFCSGKRTTFERACSVVGVLLAHVSISDKERHKIINWVCEPDKSTSNACNQGETERGDA